MTRAHCERKDRSGRITHQETCCGWWAAHLKTPQTRNYSLLGTVWRWVEELKVKAVTGKEAAGQSERQVSYIFTSVFPFVISSTYQVQLSLALKIITRQWRLFPCEHTNWPLCIFCTFHDLVILQVFSLLLAQGGFSFNKSSSSHRY